MSNAPIKVFTEKVSIYHISERFAVFPTVQQVPTLEVFGILLCPTRECPRTCAQEQLSGGRALFDSDKT